MRAFSSVRFRVKPGMADEFVATQASETPKFNGFVGGSLIKTGERTYCFIGEWKDVASLAAARPEMIGMLDRVRHTLEDLGGGLGVTDPVSGEAVLDFPAVG